jgi:alpha-mannosidase
MLFLKERIGKIISELRSFTRANEIQLTDYEYVTVPEPFADVQSRDIVWTSCKGLSRCGGNGDYYYFRTEFTLEEEFKGKTVFFQWNLRGGTRKDTTSPQGACYVNGKFVQGLDDNHESVILTENAKAGEHYEICLRVYTGQEYFWSSMDSSVGILEVETEKLYYDLKVPYEVAELLNKEDDNYITIIQCLNAAINYLDFRQPFSEEFYHSIMLSEQYIQEEFYNKRCNPEGPKVYCVGHTHIDIAWLWTLETAKDKAIRSFGTVIEFMEKYPEYKFMSSQPHLYKAVKEKQPDVYENIAKRIKTGQWEAEGGMFVEADCNLPNGESFIRQILKGKKYFKDEFGLDNEVLWLPDVFGYSAALPQIMKQCGLSYFMTTKISWNETNKMPYDTFWWKGIDGTEVLTHFIPASDYDKFQVRENRYTTYNAMLEPRQVKGAWNRYQQKDKNKEVLISFGYGDGGGGPTKDMIENQRRLAKGIPGCPATVMSTSNEFFHILDDRAKETNFPKWDGELYLEYHRGTYTSMARNKKYNRKAEILLHNIELAGVLSKNLINYPYPVKRLEELWETVLHNQFHDILPGTSIQEVYEVSQDEYTKLFAEGTAILDNSLEVLTDDIAAPRDSVVVYNMNGFEANGYVTFSADKDLTKYCLTDNNKQYPVQKLEGDLYLSRVEKVPSIGYKAFGLEQSDAKETYCLLATKELLENEYIRITMNQKGQMSSIYDKKAEREILPEGTLGNVLMTYEDRPHNWDAWDINSYYTEKSWEVSEVTSIVAEQGSLRSGIKIVRQYLTSTITQYIYIYQDSPRIEVKNEIDWKENHLLLKALLPVDIHTSEATYDIQYGNVTRPTHYNTSWDYAKFEVCHHKWLDISEDNYGVSILNDCKYGCNVHEGVIGLSLLKSATSPNKEADKEFHEFTYTIYPHRGDWKTAGVVKEAYQLNNPLNAIKKKKESGTLPASYQWCTMDAENVMIEVVKEPEKPENNAVIVRLYEYHNRRTKVNLSFDDRVCRIIECNMLEEEKAVQNIVNNEVSFEIKPYEIKTFKVIKA